MSKAVYFGSPAGTAVFTTSDINGLNFCIGYATDDGSETTNWFHINADAVKELQTFLNEVAGD